MDWSWVLAQFWESTIDIDVVVFLPIDGNCSSKLSHSPSTFSLLLSHVKNDSSPLTMISIIFWYKILLGISTHILSILLLKLWMEHCVNDRAYKANPPLTLYHWSFIELTQHVILVRISKLRLHLEVRVRTY